MFNESKSHGFSLKGRSRTEFSFFGEVVRDLSDSLWIFIVLSLVWVFSLWVISVHGLLKLKRELACPDTGYGHPAPFREISLLPPLDTRLQNVGPRDAP
jgi:hypothetical protein